MASLENDILIKLKNLAFFQSNRNILINTIIFISSIFSIFFIYYYVFNLGNKKAFPYFLVFIIILLELVLIIILSFRLIKAKNFILINAGIELVSTLRNRLIVAFSLGVSIPIIIIVIFLTYFFYNGIKSWFNKNISTVLEQSIIIGESYIEGHILQLKETVISVADDLADMKDRLLDDSDLFNKILEGQAEARSLSEAIVLELNTYSILAHTKLSFSLIFENIEESYFIRAAKGEVVLLPSEPTKIRMLYKLNHFNDSYLIIGRFIDQNIIEYIDKANGTATEYFRLKNHIIEIQIIVIIIFVLFAILLLLLAISCAQAFIDKLVQPINDLVIATEKVKDGDLSVQIAEQRLIQDEIGTLSLAFNRMIKTISRQQKDLVAIQRFVSWSDIARKVAHEIINPLTPIQLSTEMLKKRFLQEVYNKTDFKKYLEIILKHTRDINRIVEEFINFAKLPIPIYDYHDIVMTLNSLIGAKRLINTKINYIFITNIDKYEFICDIAQINWVINNLFKNAEESLKSRLKNKKIILEFMVKDKNYIEISVADNGAGFSKSIINNAIDSYITTKPNGSGLGLAIVAKIVKDHLGKISIANLASGGAVVKLMFNNKKLIFKLK